MSKNRGPKSGISVAVAFTLAFALTWPEVTRANDVVQDAKYLIDNTQLDLVDIVTSPSHILDEDSILRSPNFYLVFAGVAGLWAASFAVDQSIRSRLHNMSSADADLLQHVSYASVGAAAASLYVYGYSTENRVAREDAITGAESAGIASLANLGFKYGFGRLRPEQDGHDHDAFFRGGRSMFSGEVTPVFSLAAAVSEYFDNSWYIAIPIYSLALVDGFGRMGHDAHWFSDVVGAGFLGAGTTELLLYLHRQHANQPGRWRLFPDAVSPTADGPKQVSGLSATWVW
jgi:membrane-associated phospholipid phosphatase